MQTKYQYLITIVLNFISFSDIEITLKIILVVVQIIGGALIIVNQLNKKDND